MLFPLSRIDMTLSSCSFSLCSNVSSKRPFMSNLPNLTCPSLVYFSYLHSFIKFIYSLLLLLSPSLCRLPGKGLCCSFYTPVTEPMPVSMDSHMKYPSISCSALGIIHMWVYHIWASAAILGQGGLCSTAQDQSADIPIGYSSAMKEWSLIIVCIAYRWRNDGHWSNPFICGRAHRPGQMPDEARGG